jgi:transposase
MERREILLDEKHCNPVGLQTAEQINAKMVDGVKRHVGVDLSKQKCWICFIDGNGDVRYETASLSSGKRESFDNLFQQGDLVLLEASTGTFQIARELNKREGIVACVVNPKSTHLDESNKKTDKQDSFGLSKFILRNPVEELPLVSIPSDREIEYRAILSQYNSIDNQNTMYVNRLHAIFHDAGFPEAGKTYDLHTRQGRQAAIASCFGDRKYSEPKALAKDIDRLLAMQEEVLEREMRKIASIVAGNPKMATILGSIPGIGMLNIAAIIAFIGDISRFSSAGQLCAYCGLVPRVSQSGQRDAKRKITKEGQAILRKFLIQAVYAMSRTTCDFKLKEKLKEMEKRMPRRKAVVAIARQLVRIMYSMLKNGTLFSGSTEQEKEEIVKYQKRKIVAEIGTYNKICKSCNEFLAMKERSNLLDWNKLGICSSGA